MEETQSIEDELSVFDGTGSGYGWSISAWQFWNRRGTPEAQKLAEVSRVFSGHSLTWFQLWSHRNPNADWDTFDLAFLNQFEPDMRPLLPEICWNKVEDWEIKWEEMKARLIHRKQQQQSQIAQETIQSQSSTEQEITVASLEIQEKKEEAKEKGAIWSSTTNSTTTTAQEQTIQESTLAKSLTENLCSYHEEIDPQELVDPKLQSIHQQDEVKEQSATLLDGEESDGGTTPGSGDAQRLANSAVVDTVVRSKEEEVHRLPPKPPNLSSEVVVGDEAADQCLTTMPAVSPCKTASVAAARGSEGDRVTDLNKGTDAAAKGTRIMSSVRAEVRRAMLLKPPPLMAAVFPWNRHKVSAATAGNGAEDSAFSKGKMEDVLNGGSNAKIYVIATAKDKAAVVEGDAATTVERRRTLAQYGGKEEKVLLPACSGTTGGRDSHSAQWLCDSGSVTTGVFIVGERSGLMEPPFRLQQALVSDPKDAGVESDGINRGSGGQWKMMEDDVWASRVETSIGVSIERWMEREERIALLRSWTNEVLRWRPCIFSWASGRSKPTRHALSKYFVLMIHGSITTFVGGILLRLIKGNLFERLGQNQQTYYGYYFKVWDPGGIFIFRIDYLVTPFIF